MSALLLAVSFPNDREMVLRPETPVMIGVKSSKHPQFYIIQADMTQSAVIVRALVSEYCCSRPQPDNSTKQDIHHIHNSMKVQATKLDISCHLEPYKLAIHERYINQYIDTV